MNGCFAVNPAEREFKSEGRRKAIMGFLVQNFGESVDVVAPGSTYTTKGWVQETNEYGMDAASFVGGAELKERYIAAAMDFGGVIIVSFSKSAEKKNGLDC